MIANDEIELLKLFLEPDPPLNHRGNIFLRWMSLYSSELKSLKQIAGELAKIANGTFHAGKNARTIVRYFRTLSAHGVVTGTHTQPGLTDLAQVFLDAAQAPNANAAGYWQDIRDTIEGRVFQSQVQRIIEDGVASVSDSFVDAFKNVQFLASVVSRDDVERALADLDLLYFVQMMNSTGFEPGRFFRLTEADLHRARQALESLFSSVNEQGFDALEPAGFQLYAKQLETIQKDIRYRVAGFISAYQVTKSQMGADFPFIDVDGSLRPRTAQRPSQFKLTPKAALTSLPLPLQLVVSGCPGSGKSHFIDMHANVPGVVPIRTQFHAETSYYDFVGSYRPVPVYDTDAIELVDPAGGPVQHGRPYVDYRFVPGPLSSALATALQNSTWNVVLVIEELNRGNCAAIFGDFLQLLDRSADGASRYGIRPPRELQQFLRSEGGLSSDDVRFPPNLFIWATMNSADQGVFPVDAAFRRRWAHRYMGYASPSQYPDEKRAFRYGGITMDWEAFRAQLNSRLLELGVHEDKLIGPYFFAEHEIGDPSVTLNKLFLYLWDDVMRFRTDELFHSKSFDALATAWDNGSGSVIMITLPSHESTAET